MNWWHEDFQSSALPTELSRPLPAHYPHNTRCLGSMSIKNENKKKSSKVLKVSNGNFLDLKKEDFVNFSMSNDMDYESFKWVFLAQGCWFVRISYITIYHKTCDKRTKFCSDTLVKKNRMNEKHKELWTTNKKG